MMKNKIYFNNTLISITITSIILLITIISFNIYKYNKYTDNFNNKINSIVDTIINEYPDITKNEIIEILNSKDIDSNNILKDYGIDIEKESIVSNNDKLFKKYIVIDLFLLMTLIILIMIIFLKYNMNKDREIKDITNLIEQINHKNYILDIDNISEDELSILKNEIYKTTIMLKEQAENSLQDKINLKNSLSDISHQLKTPLTSIMIMLDNIIDHRDMDNKQKEKFILNIKREITNINFLVKSLLTLSKFDASAIKYINEEVLISKIIDEAVKNVLGLCDLKNIDIIINGNKTDKIYCDYRWQVEAITNILKNCVEHSNNNSKIDIFYEKNKVYTCITIRDYGCGIDEEDLNHIFERFYKGKNTHKDSIGIGLALSKTIIEENNGTIYVDSILNKGTTFIIKYFN